MPTSHIIGKYQATPPTLTDGQTTQVRVTSTGALVTDGAGTISSIVPGTGATNLGKAEDAAHTSGDVGVMILTKRTDTAASSAGTDGDYATLNTDSLGHVWNREGFAPGAENNTNNVIHTSHRFYNATTGKPTVTTNLSFQTATISSSPCLLVGARVVNTTASTRYLFTNNATSIAGAAAPTFAPILIPASGAYHLTPEELGRLGDVFTTALTIGNSSTAATFTAGTAGDLLVTVYWTTSTN